MQQTFYFQASLTLYVKRDNQKKEIHDRYYCLFYISYIQCRKFISSSNLKNLRILISFIKNKIFIEIDRGKKPWSLNIYIYPRNSYKLQLREEGCIQLIYNKKGTKKSLQALF